VRRENPPYIRSQPSGKATTSTSASAAAPVKQTISESELDPLMELDIIRAVLNMGFPQDKVRAALHRKLEQTGLPFFSLEPCIEAVLQYMEEETRQTLQKASNRGIENEATAQQVAKIQAVQPRSQQQSSSSLVASATSNSPVVSSSNHASSSTSSATQELAEELERIRDIRMCKVCMDAEMDVVFLPCQHMVTCSSCALALAQCPICREDIKYSIKPILS
ncbi:death-associated inhibitor of apoptosis 2-like 2, partial [Homarus americanus]